jgi:hypothetical protein
LIISLAIEAHLDCFPIFGLSAFFENADNAQSNAARRC